MHYTSHYRPLFLSIQHLRCFENILLLNEMYNAFTYSCGNILLLYDVHVHMYFDALYDLYVYVLKISNLNYPYYR